MKYLVLVLVVQLIAIHSFAPHQHSCRSKAVLSAQCESRELDKNGKCPGETGYVSFAKVAPLNFAEYKAMMAAKKSGSSGSFSVSKPAPQPISKSVEPTPLPRKSYGLSSGYKAGGAPAASAPSRSAPASRLFSSCKYLHITPTISMQLLLALCATQLLMAYSFAPHSFKFKAMSALNAQCEAREKDKNGKCPGESGYVSFAKEAPLNFAEYKAMMAAKKAGASGSPAPSRSAPSPAVGRAAAPPVASAAGPRKSYGLSSGYKAGGAPAASAPSRSAPASRPAAPAAPVSRAAAPAPSRSSPVTSIPKKSYGPAAGYRPASQGGRAAAPVAAAPVTARPSPPSAPVTAAASSGPRKYGLSAGYRPGSAPAAPAMRSAPAASAASSPAPAYAGRSSVSAAPAAASGPRKYGLSAGYRPGGQASPAAAAPAPSRPAPVAQAARPAGVSPARSAAPPAPVGGPKRSYGLSARYAKGGR
eukprot:CAMPEP_0182437070 /NCGR_PEP_ID=MMETSP1167-20130531/84797_1 /TAXON_ID=2988 /ORGANISM="Mallomonas Sp, Strain CCMP3275" /LENGTH=474 /DNA_ID=CAMNT_0024629857 /DNA_START=162 /DNA_END=1586 /DNA_ORIENTATION=-